MTIFLRCVCLCGVVAILAPIILAYYIALLLLILVLELLVYGNVKNVINDWLKIVYIDIRIFMKIIEYGFSTLVMAWKSYKKNWS